MRPICALVHSLGWASTYGNFCWSGVCGSVGIVFRTTDGGFTWQQLSSDTSYFRLFKLHFSDEWNGICVGDGEILRTRNGGDTWQQQLFGFGGFPSLYAAYLVDSLHGWAGGIDRFLETDDAGAS